MSEKIMVTRSSMPDFDEYVAEIKSIWDSHWLTNMGPKHEEFSVNLKKYLGVDRIELMTNGHMALEMLLQAFDFPIDSEVITTPFTFASTTHAIVRNGLKPVFCDIDKDTYCIDVNMVERLITDKTVAIVPVHVYGNICDVDALNDIADKHGLKVIYDAAHTFGERYKGKSVVSYGDASMCSFHATKVFNSIEGGAVVYKDDVLGAKLYDLKNFGIRNAEEVASIGANAKLNEFCAAMGICNLRHIDKEIEKRKKIYDLYIELLQNVDGIRLNYPQKDVESNYAYFPIVVDEKIYGINRDRLSELFMSKDIFTRKYFYPLTSDFECYSNQYDSDKTPIAKNISLNVLTLPIYADLTEDTVRYICDIIKSNRA